MARASELGHSAQTSPAPANRKGLLMIDFHRARQRGTGRRTRTGAASNGKTAGLALAITVLGVALVLGGGRPASAGTGPGTAQADPIFQTQTGPGQANPESGPRSDERAERPPRGTGRGTPARPGAPQPETDGDNAAPDDDGPGCPANKRPLELLV